MAVSTEVVPVWIRIQGKLAITNQVFVLKGQRLPIQRSGVAIEAASQPTQQFRPGELKYLVLEIEGQNSPMA